MAVVNKSTGDVLTAANWNTIDNELDIRKTTMCVVDELADFPYTTSSATYAQLTGDQSTTFSDFSNLTGSTIYARMIFLFGKASASTWTFRMYDGTAAAAVTGSEIAGTCSAGENVWVISDAFDISSVGPVWYIQAKTNDAVLSLAAGYLLIYSVED